MEIRITPPLTPQTQLPHTTTPGCYKETILRAVTVLDASEDNCIRHSTIFNTRALDSNDEMKDASGVQEGQLSFEGKLITFFTIAFGFAGITGAAINPAGVNQKLLETIKGVCETSGKVLQPSVQATSALSQANQQNTKTKQSIAANDTHGATATGQEMDSKVKTISGGKQQLVDAAAIKV